MKEVRLYKRRWLVLLAMMAIVIAMQIQWLALASVADVSTKTFENQLPLFNLFPIEVLSIAYIFMLFFLSVPSVFIIRKFGFANPIRIVAIAVIIASLLKFIYYDNLLILFWVQIFLATFQCFVIGGFTDLAQRWFALRERGLVLGLLYLAFYMGIIIALVVSPTFIDGSKIDLQKLFLIYALISTILSLITLIFIKDNPPTHIKEEESDLNIEESLSKLFRSKSTIILVLIVSMYWAWFQTLLITLDNINNYIGKNMPSSIMGILLIGGGLVGSSLIGYLSDIFRKRKLFFVSNCIISLIGILLLILNINSIISYLAIALMGFSLLTINSLGMQYLSELLYPARAAFSQGVMLVISYASAVIYTTIVIAKRDSYSQILMIALLVIASFASLASFFIRESSRIMTEVDIIEDASNYEKVRLE